MGLKVTEAEYADWVKRGLVVEDAPTQAEPPPKKAELLPTLFDGHGTWVIGIRCDSGMNGGRLRKGHLATAGRQRRVVVRAMCAEPATLLVAHTRLKVGRLRVELTRLGPGRVDSHAVLGDHLKHVVDAIADCLSLDDADPRIEWRGSAEKCERYGVRVRIESRT